MFHRVVLSRAAVGRLRRHRHRPHDDADLPARCRASSRGRRPDDLGEPQPDRVERAQVHRADRAVSRELPKASRCARWSRREFRARRGTSSARSRPDDGAVRATHRSCPCDTVPRRRRNSARGSFTSRSTACAAPAPSSCRRCSSGLGCTCHGDQPGDGRSISRVRRSRSPRTSASWNGSCSRRGAAIGFAVDPDVDRLALVSDAGKAIGEDFTLALAARLVLRHRHGPVVTNLSTSRIVEDVARAAGVPVIRAPVGEVNVAVRMRDEQAPDRRRRERRRDSVRGASRARRAGRVPRCCCSCCTRRTGRCRRSSPSCRVTSS